MNKCKCGCGILVKSNYKRGHCFNGKKRPDISRRFSGSGNPNHGKHLSEEQKAKISGSNHGQWKGDNVGYEGIHDWVERRLEKTDMCQICNITPPYDLANRSGKYLRNLDDWWWLCRRCHMVSDGRLRRLSAHFRVT